MSQLSRTNFETLYGSSGTQFPDNTSGSITELIMRTFGKNLSDSFLNSVTDFQKLTTATGTDTYAVTGGITAYASGFAIAVLFTNGNTGAATLNVNSLGAKAIKKSGGSALVAGDISDGEIKLLTYDGTNFQIVGGSGSGGSGTVESVTGDGVDNSDPDNPVLTFPTPGDIGAEIAGAAATALSDANDYTDTAIAQEVVDRDAAIGSALSGLSWKNVRVATTVAGTLATSFENGDTVDGVTLATGNRILIKNQATASQNGIYIVAASGSPTRATDADINSELQNAAVLVAEGTAGTGTAWVQTQSAINIGSTDIVFQQLGSSVPNADGSTRGISKLYTSTGSNTDGSMDQNSITNALAGKQASGSYLTPSNIVGTITNGVTTNAPSEDAVFDALALKAPLASPTFTGTPLITTTPTTADSSHKIADTAFVQQELSAAGLGNKVQFALVQSLRSLYGY